MHYFSIDISLVKDLLSSQFPKWASLPLENANCHGTSYEIYRLGTDMAVRLPKRSIVSERAEKECVWLPQIAPYLPIPVPAPLGAGKPQNNYPAYWSIVPWFKGEVLTHENVDPNAPAIFAEFLSALHGSPIEGGPLPSIGNSFRGAPLLVFDEQTRRAVDQLSSFLDAKGALSFWESALKVRLWDKKGVWIHGDFHPGNVITYRGKIQAIVDFDNMAMGDPAWDLIMAWTIFSKKQRSEFREKLDIDEATWIRGRAAAFAFGIRTIFFLFYGDFPYLKHCARIALKEVLDDVGVRHSFG